MRSWDCSQIENEEEEEIWRGRGPDGSSSGMKSNNWRRLWHRSRMEGDSLNEAGGHAKGTGASGV